MTSASVTQETVNENLKYAIENGYDLHGGTVDEIVNDLLAYSVDCEDSDAETLTPLVQVWHDANKRNVLP